VHALAADFIIARASGAHQPDLGQVEGPRLGTCESPLVWWRLQFLGPASGEHEAGVLRPGVGVVHQARPGRVAVRPVRSRPTFVAGPESADAAGSLGRTLLAGLLPSGTPRG
jgi:hypothetical protein